MSETRKEGGPSWLAASIVCAALVVSGSIVWLGLQIRASQTRSPATAPSGTPRAIGANDPPRAVPDPPRATAEVLSMVVFQKEWEASFVDRAEADCFRALEAKGHDVDPALHYFVAVSPEGKVTTVSWAKPEPTKMHEELFPCVGAIIKEMTFPPADAARKGKVQAHRKGAFRAAEAPEMRQP